MSHDDGRLDLGPEWWSANLYVERRDAVDAVAARVVPWLGAVTQEIGAPRWFFMRYFDMRGHHLRLRVRAQPERVDDLCERAADLVELARMGAGDSLDPSFVPDRMIPDIVSRPALVSRVYSPEYAKYGGVRGIEIAEGLFTWTSSWHAEHEVLKLPKYPDRAAFALALGRELDCALPADLRDPLWRAHFQRWGRRLQGFGRGPGEDVASVRRRVSAELEPTVTWHKSGAQTLAARIVDSIDEISEYLDESKRTIVLLDYFHMEMNRLGLNPVEECIVGTLVDGGVGASHAFPVRKKVEVVA
ncbi:lantibiotic dehydratase C-terminal domain-containing protein [Pengzhenrongella phosphoraccumulans]